jgi:hypothetical protein
MGLGSEIRDPEKTYSGSRIQGSKKAPDPGSATLIRMRIWIRIRIHIDLKCWIRIHIENYADPKH